MKNPDKNSIYIKTSRGHLAKTEDYDPASMVLFTLTPDMRPTDEQIRELEEAKKYPIVFEDDCPETTPEMAEKFRKAARERDMLKRKTS